MSRPADETWKEAKVNDEGFVQLFIDEGWTPDEVRDVAEAWGVLHAAHALLPPEPDDHAPKRELHGWLAAQIFWHRDHATDPRFAALPRDKALEALAYYEAEFDKAMRGNSRKRMDELSGYIYAIHNGQSWETLKP